MPEKPLPAYSPFVLSVHDRAAEPRGRLTNMIASSLSATMRTATLPRVENVFDLLKVKIFVA
jgi:hypothetical protein